MIFNKDDEKTIKNIERYTGVPEVQIKKIFRTLINEVVCNYEDNNHVTTTIPLLGSINLNYNGDRVVRGEDGKHYKQADISIIFQSSEFLKRIVGQLSDGIETDIEKYLMNEIAKTLNAQMS